jgi:hypothetical protein
MATEQELLMVQMREKEVADYDENIANYQHILTTVDGDWDADLVHLKDLEMQEAARQCSLERLDRLAALQLHQQISNLLKTETVERTKANAILQAMKLRYDV